MQDVAAPSRRGDYSASDASGLACVGHCVEPLTKAHENPLSNWRKKFDAKLVRFRKA